MSDIATQNGSESPLHVYQRTSFGPPLPISAELNGFSHHTLLDFIEEWSSAHKALAACVRVGQGMYYAPRLPSIQSHFAYESHGLSSVEIGRFRNSRSYQILGQGGEPELRVIPKDYIHVALHLGDWNLDEWEIVSAPDEFQMELEQSCVNGMSPLVLMRALGRMPTNSMRTTKDIDMEAVIFAAARYPNVHRKLEQLVDTMSAYGVVPEALMRNALAREFKTTAGPSWLAWLLLLLYQEKLWRVRYSTVAASKGSPPASQRFQELVADVLLNVVPYASFDAAVPYFQAGVPPSLIPSAVADGIAPDVASSLNV